MLTQKNSSIAILSLLLLGCVAPQTRSPIVTSENAKIEAQKQQQLVVEDHVKNYRRLQNVASKIMTKGTALCADNKAPYYGFNAWNMDSFDAKWKEVAKQHYQLDEHMLLINISPDSPAAKAGIKEGDRLLAINSWTVPTGKDAQQTLNKKLVEQGKPLQAVELTILQDKVEKKIAVTPIESCNYEVVLLNNDVKNAYADGKNIVIYKGMMDFFKTDEEIALVLSHELAHNSMKHIDAKKKNVIVGSIFGLLLDVAAATAGVNTNGEFSKAGGGIAGNAYSVEFEQEADYVGLYYMAIAGYPINESAGFWRRMAISDSKAITAKTSHPTTPERFLAIEETVKEINLKVAEGRELKPELKK
jgi:beta-barrel assembly-enhancing protease